MKQLLQQISKSSEGRVTKRLLHFLNAQGFRQEFEQLEQELRDCLVQLSTILNVVQFTSQVGASAAAMAHPRTSHGFSSNCRVVPSVGRHHSCWMHLTRIYGFRVRVELRYEEQHLTSDVCATAKASAHLDVGTAAWHPWGLTAMRHGHH